MKKLLRLGFIKKVLLKTPMGGRSIITVARQSLEERGAASPRNISMEREVAQARQVILGIIARIRRGQTGSKYGQNGPHRRSA